jgi:hypothetical protein
MHKTNILGLYRVISENSKVCIEAGLKCNDMSETYMFKIFYWDGLKITMDAKYTLSYYT